MTKGAIKERELKGIKESVLVEKYNELHSVWKVGEYFGIKGQCVHSFLTRIGKIKKMRVFTSEEKDRLLREYLYYRDRGELKILAKEMGRTEQYLSRQARALGLTSKTREYNFSPEVHERLSQSAKKRIQEHGHPRGMAGKKHSESTKQIFSEKSKRLWVEKRDEWLTDEVRKMKSDNMRRNQASGVLGVRSRCYMFDVQVGEKKFLVKSTWEYDIALYLHHLLECGYISDWDYEPVAFDFDYDGRGVRSYKPDFRVVKRGREYFIEVKGWQDAKSKLKKEMMATQYPNVRMLYVDQSVYKKIRNKYGKVLANFGCLKEIMGVKVEKCSIQGCDKPRHSKGLCRHHFYEQYNR